MDDLYILRGHKPVAEPNLLKWARAFENAPRWVAQDDYEHVRVSTVFLGLDHSFGSGPPLLFETMVFGGPLNGEMDRYATWNEAEAGHKAMLDAVVKAQRPKA